MMDVWDRLEYAARLLPSDFAVWAALEIEVFGLGLHARDMAIGTWFVGDGQPQMVETIYEHLDGWITICTLNIYQQPEAVSMPGGTIVRALSRYACARADLPPWRFMP